MEYRVLGPFEVLEDGRRRLELGGPRQRALLTLLFHANEVVSVDRLMEELWAAGPPGSVANSLQQDGFDLAHALDPNRDSGEGGAP